MPADLSVIAWIWLVISVSIVLMFVWVIWLELRQIYRNFRVWIRREH
ncbi:hypothetical protein [Acidithiobacillus thiooxidans]|nr:hypothetical protein [Acidithiobacillus thiooxidans]